MWHSPFSIAAWRVVIGALRIPRITGGHLTSDSVFFGYHAKSELGQERLIRSRLPGGKPNVKHAFCPWKASSIEF